MPEAGAEPDKEDIPHRPPCPLPAAAQGDVQILPEPCGQGNVPPPPELRHGGGGIGVVEVFREVKAQHLPHADGHVGIAGEVEIDLERVRDGADPRRDRCGVRHGGDVLPDGPHLVGDEHLLAQTDHQPLQTLAGLAHRLPPVLQVVGHCLVLHDRPRDQLGEHDHIGTKVDDVALGLHIPAVDINGVGQGLEGVEADAQRQGANALNFGKGGAQQGIHAAQHKVCVLEVEQHMLIHSFLECQRKQA